MLQRLLELVAEGGLHSYTDLARELGVSKGLLEQMIEDLAWMGYLRPVVGVCQAQCAGCPMAESCAVGGPTRVWMLTEKGQLQQQSGAARAGVGQAAEHH